MTAPEVADSTDLSVGDWLPWAWCNLRRNPFGELTREERVELAVVDVESIGDQVSRPHTAVQLIGGCGRGKTTRLLALARAMPDSTYVYLPEDTACPVIAAGNPTLIDEAQRLPTRVRRLVFASGLPLVLATHRDLRRPLLRAGYQVRTQRIGAGNDAGLVCELMNRRIAASRLAPGPLPRLSEQDANTLVAKFGTNIRAMEGYLYEQVQAQVFSPKSDHGEVRFVD